ncbi:sulfite exporter TauE/SafE family protein [Bradyrhizobium sp.]|uniref:sulfite exporter TauE/SafE family protein n=1 Tax=Bradyrhizobium sp. TaxID=376 RepID=UPI001DCA2A68|nr:sulfite exporter TauE/SafE family protein [Bradyrhizobium sp.]MBI5320076.1 sulfite exporter TauE/SafE family protein [Bradyrhizobium sp.]
MDGNLLLIFAFATFLGGFVSGFSGFAMGIVVSGFWLHLITPIQTAALIAGYGLLTQGYGIAKLRHELSWQDIWPLTLGTAIGIPIGVMLLTHIDPTHVRFGVGVLLVLYAVYSLTRPPLGPFRIGAPADVAIGIGNGLVGGITGLGGIISTISVQLRGWSKDKQRAVFQPVLFAAFVIISISQLVAGSYTLETVKLYGIGLPFMVAGIWIGFRLYGTINDETFRKAVLVLVLLAGVSLVASASGLVPLGRGPS